MNSDDKLFSILNYSNDIFLFLSKDFLIQELNSLAEELYGWQRGNVLKQNYFNLCSMQKIVPLVRISDLIKQKKETIVTYTVEQIIDTNNKVRVITWRANKLTNCDFIIIGRDVTKQRLAETKLISTEDYFKSIMQHIPSYVFWKDNNSVILGCNANFARIANETMDSIIGKTDYELPWKMHETEHFRADDKEVIETGKAKLNIEETMRYSDGTEAVLLTHKMPLRDKNNKIIGIVGVFIDITQRKQFEKELLAREKAEAVNIAKTQFIQNMEHDLRTPTAGIYGLVDSLAYSEKDLEHKKNLELIAAASKQLLNMLDDILSFSRVDHGKIAAINKKIDIRKIINNLIVMQTPAATTKKIKLTFTCMLDVPKIIISDENRIFRILLNLISNALKFTHKGFVKVFLSISEKVSDTKYILKFIVSDSGIGIPKDKQDLIYERFNRGTASNCGLYAGMGLGLAIVKQFIEELGGEIDVTSEVDQGSTFTCLLPVQIPLLTELRQFQEENISNLEQSLAIPVEETNSDLAQSSATSQNHFSIIDSEETPKAVDLDDSSARITGQNLIKNDMKILVVEDVSIAQIAVLTIFKNLHPTAKVDIAGTGQAAVDYINQHNYDLIFMDLGLPIINGYEAARKIRELGKTSIPIIALTAHGADLVKDKCIAAGMNDVLRKPLNLEKINFVMKEWVSPVNSHP